MAGRKSLTRRRDSEDEANFALAAIPAQDEAPPKKRGRPPKHSVQKTVVEPEYEGSGDEEVFELESIKASKRKGKQIFYLVRWKGYGSEDETWEPESGLGDASEVLEAFLAGAGQDVAEEPSKKRGGRPRKSVTAAESSADEETPAVRAKKQRNSNGAASTANGKAAARQSTGSTKGKEIRNSQVAAPDSDDEMREAFELTGNGSGDDEGAEERANDWDTRYSKEKDWSKRIDRIVTIEKDEFGIKVLIEWTDGATKWLSNDQARTKFPLKLLDFYETHLTFATQDAEDPEAVATNGQESD